MFEISSEGTSSAVLTSSRPIFTITGYRTVCTKYARLSPVRRSLAFKHYIYNKFITWASDDQLERLGEQGCFWEVDFVMDDRTGEPDNHKVKVTFSDPAKALMFKLSV